MKPLLLLLLLLPVIALPATYNSDGSNSDVQAKINSASAGDTVTVPSGSFTWSSITVTNGIILSGAGSNSSIITLGANGLSVTKHATTATKIHGFKFTKSSGGNNSKAISFQGGWKTAKPIIFYSNAVSIAASGFINITTPGGIIIAKNYFTGEWDDSFITPKNPGDDAGSWIANSTMGMDDTAGEYNIYVEGNTFYGGTNQGIDADDGSRVVFRYNLCYYMSFNSHGMDTSEDGVRHWEVYFCSFYNENVPGGDINADIANQNWAIWIRGGTGVIFSNIFDDLANSNWGPKSEGKFDIRTQQDGSGSSYGTVSAPTAKYSTGVGDYPRERQLGQSWSLSGTNAVGINGGVGDYITDPIYVWGNTGAGATNGSFKGWSNGGSWGSQTGYFVEDRDYVFGNTAKPSYTAYTYPHPLLGDGGGGGGSSGNRSATVSGTFRAY